jgi:hypothetical protein
MNSREFLEYAKFAVTEHNLYILTQYLYNSDYGFRIDYSQFPDATVGNLDEDMNEPVGFQEYMELF